MTFWAKVQVVVGLSCLSYVMYVDMQPLESGSAKDHNTGSVHWKSLRSGFMSALKSNRTCLGDIRALSPTGKFDTDVPGSELKIRLDLQELQKRWAFYQEVADKYCLQASVVAAMASRESRGGLDLYDTWGFADHGHAYGILQCNLKHSGLGLGCVSCFWDSLCHIDLMVSKILVPYIHQVCAKLTSWTQDMCLQGGVAAYNGGVSTVNSWPGVDNGTTHKDYSNDVIARAQYLYKLGWN